MASPFFDWIPGDPDAAKPSACPGPARDQTENIDATSVDGSVQGDAMTTFAGKRTPLRALFGHAVDLCRRLGRLVAR
jgi:hypothetical protein